MIKVLTIMFFCALCSCSKTQILNAPMLQIDTLSKAYKGFAQDTTAKHNDTTKIPIEFNPTVDSWNNSDVIVGN